MIVYLDKGWYTAASPGRLQDSVIDGALDTASMLFRAAVPAAVLSQLALKVHTLATLARPLHRQGDAAGTLSAKQRAAIDARLTLYTDSCPALQSFVQDAFEHVGSVGELRALYLHLMHVAQIMQILAVARQAETGGLLGLAPTMPGATAGTSSANLSAAARAVVAQVPEELFDPSQLPDPAAVPRPKPRLQ